MKTHKSIFKTLIILFTLVPVITFAQPSGQGRHSRGENDDRLEQRGNGDRMDKIPGLTEAQEQQIKKIHTGAQADILPLKNQLNELDAKLQTLQTANSADMKAINETIDKISIIKASIEKRRAQAHQDVRKLLNDEQRLFVDTHFQHRKGDHEGRAPRG